MDSTCGPSGFCVNEERIVVIEKNQADWREQLQRFMASIDKFERIILGNGESGMAWRLVCVEERLKKLKEHEDPPWDMDRVCASISRAVVEALKADSK
jgi:hypothetical protein